MENEPKKGKFPASIKIDPQLKQDLDDWAWINRTNFSELMAELGKKLLEQNPLTRQEKDLLATFKKYGTNPFKFDVKKMMDPKKKKK